MLKKLYQTVTRYVPPVSLWIFLLGIFAGLLHLFFFWIPGFAEGFNTSVAAAVRAALAYLTGVIPFSVAETVLFLLPALAVILLLHCILSARDNFPKAMRYVTGMLSAAVAVYVAFVFTLAPGYQATPLEEKVGLAREPVSPEQLGFAAYQLSEAAAAELENVTFRHGSSSVMPYTYGELSEKLMDAYKTVREEYPFLQELTSSVKPLASSPLVTYTHISGIYTVFTGEANLNVHYPDYILPFTAAHELAHQRGISREDEANFVAFLVCIASDDPYIRYSGYLNMYEYVASALYSADRELYYDIVYELDPRLRQEMIAYSEFFEPYRKTVVSEVSDAVNNAYLVVQGTAGVKSYGMVVDLAVAYIEKQFGLS